MSGKWNGHKFAVSFTFDDGYHEHATEALPTLEEHGFRGTFYLALDGLLQYLPVWRLALKRGHEIGNHTVSHPGPRNDKWSSTVLEEIDLPRMEWELDTSQDVIEKVAGVRPVTFAYPHGCHHIGEGYHGTSYYGLVCKRFLAARLQISGAFNPIDHLTYHALTAFPLDSLSFATYLNVIPQVESAERWVIFVGHRFVQEEGRLAVCRGVLAQILKDLTARDVWVDRVDKIVEFIRDNSKHDN